MLTNHRGKNWKHKKCCYPLLELQMLVTYARATRNVHGTCVSDQVLLLCAIQVHAKPALAAHPGNIYRNDLLLNHSMNLAGTCAVGCLYLTPPCKVWVEIPRVQFPLKASKVKALDLNANLFKFKFPEYPETKGP